MEGHGEYENAVQLLSFAFGGNGGDMSHSPNADPKLYFMAEEREQPHPIPSSLPHWINCEQTSHDYLGFLASEGSEFQKKNVSYNSAMSSGFEPAVLSFNMDAEKGNFLELSNEGGPVNNLTSAECQICIQEQESGESFCDPSQPHSRLAVASREKSKAHGKISRRRATITDRHRRLRIAEKLDALKKLLPPSEEGCKASLLDDIIDHTKYLQLKIKELSQSRLGGEPTPEPFIFLEGYGHYLSHKQMLTEPLEELMGRLLELNPSAATQLLESRGLYMMPMALAEELNKSI